MHFLKKKGLGRRTFLRGLSGAGGVVLGLPLLEAMLNGNGDALAQGAPLPLRFVTWSFGNGVNLDQFEPTAAGTSGWDAAEMRNGKPLLLSPLADVKPYINICTGLQNPNNPTITNPQVAVRQTVTHHNGLPVLSGHRYVDRSADIDRDFATDWGGPTVDQVIANAIARDTPLPFHSLQFGVSKGVSPVDGGSASEVISVRDLVSSEGSTLIPLPPQRNPLLMWQTIFGDAPAPDAVRGSMLDFLSSDILRLQRRLGPLDRQRMEAHLDGIRALELRIGTASSCVPPLAPIDQNTEPVGSERLTAINQIMADLLGLAFACDLTRVASVLFLGIAGEAAFAEVTTPATTPTSTHHFWSHSPGDEYDAGVSYIMNRFGDWLRTLRSRTEPGGGNLLDSTILLAASEVAWGQSHQIARHPMLLAGHARNYLKFPGIHYQPSPPPATGRNGSDSVQAAGNTSDVLFTCLKAFDPAAMSVGAGTTGSSSVVPDLLQ